MDENTLIFTFYVVDAHLIRIKKLSAWPSLIQMDVPKSQIHRYKDANTKNTQMQDIASLKCLQNIYNTVYELN